MLTQRAVLTGRPFFFRCGRGLKPLRVSASHYCMVSITGSTTAAQIRDFERQMESIAREKIPRWIQYSLNSVAIEASKQMKAVLPTVIENPTNWMANALVARKGDLKVATAGEAKASMEVKDDQSTVAKYLFGGDAGMDRTPGDVGPANRTILIPSWPGLMARTKVKKNKSGDMVKTALSRLFPGTGVKGGVFWDAPVINGRQRVYGLWGRAPDNKGAPMLLLSAHKKVHHPDKLSEPTRRVAEAAMATLPRRLEAELASQIALRNARAAGGSP